MNGAGGSSSSCICAICYEDVVPSSELLQTITVCGHVFHELCLQQWIEFCPNGRTPSCPLCKQKCGARDVHRLYFQSSSESAPEKAATLSQMPVADRARFLQMEGKIQMLTGSCQDLKDQIQEFEDREAAHLEQLRALEADRSKGRRERGQLVESLSRTREELRRSSELREELLERNTAMARELAVYQLANDVNLSEGEMMRLVTVDRGSANKDEVIGVMTKSLYLRNKSFKELMHKCQELGMGERRAEQRSQKLTEQLKRAKARMQELATVQEVKENAQLRSCRPAAGAGAGAASRRRPLALREDLLTSPHQTISERPHPESRSQSPRLTCLTDDFYSPMSEGLTSGPNSSRGIFRDGHDRLDDLDWEGDPCAARPRPGSRRPPACKDNREDDGGWIDAEKKDDSGIYGRRFGRPQMLDSNSRSGLAEVNMRESYEERHPHDEGFYGVQSARLRAQPAASRLDDEVDEMSMLQRGPPIRQETGLPFVRPSPSSRFMSSGPRADGPGGGHPDDGGLLRRVQTEDGRELTELSSDGEPDDVVMLKHRPGSMLPIRQEAGLGGQAAAASFGARPPSGASGREASSSTFIVSGADGRGGRVTVLKPPRTTFLGGGSGGVSSGLGVHRAKRLKSTSSSHVAGNARPATALKIEHFFGQG